MPITVVAIVGSAVGGWCIFVFDFIFVFFYNFYLTKKHVLNLPLSRGRRLGYLNFPCLVLFA